MPQMTRDDLFIPLMGSPAAAGLARTLLAERLQKWKFADISDDVLLVASEMVANAAEAAPGRELKLKVTRDIAGLLIQVWDPGPGTPVSRDVVPLTLEQLDAAPDDAWDAGGRWGLPIVQAIASDCGWRPTTPHGKWVWARLP